MASLRHAAQFVKRSASCLAQKIPCVVTRISSCTKLHDINPHTSFVTQNGIHTSFRRHDLMEFFDSKDNWGESSVKVGRPWKMEELRLKSNTDLHKLWYILLKERNMLMTMEAEYTRQGELFPSPERFEKVEVSMENLQDVVSERDRAVNLLETGETGEPGRRWVINQLGEGFWRNNREHLIPLRVNKRFKEMYSLHGPWQNRFLKLQREKTMLRQTRARVREADYKRKVREVFPDTDID